MNPQRIITNSAVPLSSTALMEHAYVLVCHTMIIGLLATMKANVMFKVMDFLSQAP